MRADRSVYAQTGVSIDKVITRAAIFAGLRRAVVDIRLTIHSCETSLTTADVSIEKIVTHTSVLARLRGTFIDLTITMRSRVSCGAIC